MTVRPRDTHAPKTPLSLHEKLEAAKADTAKWSQIAASAGLSPAAALVARNMARSSQAAVTLGEKALAYRMICRRTCRPPL